MNPDRPPFDPTGCPLEGTTLIEASAGTGKTYTIASLYLRLLLEGRLEPSKILVVTFTVAATAELAERIRRRVRAALIHFRENPQAGQGNPPDPFADEMAERCGGRDEAVRILTRSLEDFDSAAIHTISGFCSRLLRELAYECGVPFDSATLDDQGALVREVASDIWRRTVATESPEFLKWLLGRRAGPDLLERAMRRAGALPEVKVLPKGFEAAAVSEIEAYHGAFERAAELWMSRADEIFEILSLGDLSRKSYEPGKFEAWRSEVTSFVESPSARFAEPPKCIAYFTPEKLLGATKKNGRTPTHPFFEAMAELLEARQALVTGFERRLAALCAFAASDGVKELARRKAALGVMYFDDLLLRVRSAAEPGGPLARKTSERFRAALIDEFQDTDPVQYEIFRNLFGGPGQTLFLIGDPKQSIYGFRGADIHAYLQASKDAKRAFTLRRNWRSTPLLVEGVNSFFGSRSSPFLLDGIRFEPSAGGRDDGEEFAVDGICQTPFVIWNPCTPKHIQGSGITGKDEGRRLAASRTCAAILSLLKLSAEGRATIGGRRIGPGDFAVLTRRNEDALRIRENLSTLGVPGVVFTSGSVFATPEARDLLTIVKAAEEPSNQQRIRAAMATGILGSDAGEIRRACDGGEGMEEWVCLFQEMNRIWTSQGFIGAFGLLAGNLGVLAGMMSSGAGERGCTNLLHLAELVHRAEREAGLGIKGVSRWLSAMTADPDSAGGEGHQLRLESEAEAVVITTVHRSKGLEYPIVMVPFSWEARLPDKPPFVYHDLGRILDFRPAFDFMQGQSLEKYEGLAESLRLLYVALTRARHACFMVWDKFKDGWASGPAYQLHHQGPPPSPADFDSLRAGFEGLSREEIASDLAALEGRSNGSVKISIPPDLPEPFESIEISSDSGEPGSGFREITRKLFATVSLVSFSSLISGHEVRNRAWAEAAVETADPDRDGFAGVSGQLGLDIPAAPTGHVDLPGFYPAFSIPGDEPMVSDPQTSESGAPTMGHSEEGARVGDLTVVASSDLGEGTETPSSIPGEEGLAGFPCGASAGTALHAILEKTDFTTLLRPNDAYGDFVGLKLIEHGFDSAWSPNVVSMARLVAQAPLPGRHGPIRLSGISTKDRIDELEFSFPVQRLDGRRLAGLFAKYTDGPWSAGFPEYLSGDWLIRSRGYMKGFIDMVLRSDGVYHILDWKSNRLNDYGPAGLTAAMAAEGYLLQYHIYALALHLHLRNRVHGYDYDRHVGGVYYVFLRGLCEPDGNGIYCDRPSRRMVEELEELLTGPGPGGMA